MSALIEYLDREKATICALREFYDKQWKVENDPRRIAELSESLTAPKRMSATPVQGGGSRREEMLCDVIDRKTAIEYGYRMAVKYKSEFTPCWERLTEEERDLLRLRFMEYLEGGGISKIADKYGIGKSEAYNRSNEALKRLSKLLFW